MSQVNEASFAAHMAMENRANVRRATNSLQEHCQRKALAEPGNRDGADHLGKRHGEHHGSAAAGVARKAQGDQRECDRPCRLRYAQGARRDEPAKQWQSRPVSSGRRCPCQWPCVREDQYAIPGDNATGFDHQLAPRPGGDGLGERARLDHHEVGRAADGDAVVRDAQHVARRLPSPCRRPAPAPRRAGSWRGSRSSWRARACRRCRRATRHRGYCRSRRTRRTPCSRSSFIGGMAAPPGPWLMMATPVSASRSAVRVGHARSAPSPARRHG